MKDKLVELIQSAVDGCSSYWAGLIADYLIAHGVTVQADVPDNNVGNKWISASERLPTSTSDYLVYLSKPLGGNRVPLGRGIATYIARDDYWEMPYPYIVTHWMPLPEAPKEV